MLRNLVDSIHQFIHNPKKVLITCLSVVLVTLLFDGTLVKIWRLNMSLVKLQNSISEVELETFQIQKQINQANDPTFIEREARDRFDLVDENDLVFVFAGEN